MKYYLIILFGIASLFSMSACSGDQSESNDETSKETADEQTAGDDVNRGIGPVKSLNLGALDQELAAKGEELFTTNCSACHKVDKRFVGPALQGVTERRSPEWIMNMILNPEQMVNEDPDAKQLLAEYLSPMANQNLTEDQARAILEYFRTL